MSFNKKAMAASATILGLELLIESFDGSAHAKKATTSDMSTTNVLISKEIAHCRELSQAVISLANNIRPAANKSDTIPCQELKDYDNIRVNAWRACYEAQEDLPKYCTNGKHDISGEISETMEKINKLPHHTATECTIEEIRKNRQ